MLGWRSYPQFLFYRESPATYLLPQLAVITVTDEVADWLLQLGAWHEQAGDPAAAAAVYHQLLEHVPDSQTARRRLTALER
jgi:predicted TPR repeat methyltransferase